MAAEIHPGNSLARQAGRRAGAVFLIIGGLSALLFSLAWYYANVSLQREQAERNTAAIQSRLETRYKDWQREAKAFATQIAISHMLDAGEDTRWDKLLAYINALGEGAQFDTAAVADSAGVIRFSHGEEADETAFLAAAARSDWYFSERHQHQHRVLRTPIWLGLRGKHGTLYLLKAIDNHLLSNLAGPGVELTLSVGGRIQASSAGTGELGKAVGTRPATRLDIVEHELLLAPPSTRLHIRQALPQAVSPIQFALAGVGMATALGLTLWAVFGVWLRQTVARVRALSSAASRFGRRHQVDDETRDALARAAGGDDEVGALRRHLRELMHNSEARDEESRAYLQTLDMLDEAVVELDADGALLRASPAWETLMGADAGTREFYSWFEPDDREDLESQVGQLFSGEKTLVSLRLRAGKTRGAAAWLECRFVPVRKAGESGDSGDSGAAQHIRGVLRDITQTYMQEKHITHMALHDALTGLPNRVLLEDRLKIALRLAARDECRVGIGFIDLDHFKNINDALGHKVGDQLLVAFASNLRAALRGGDTLARWGGDEFVVLLPDMPGLDEIHRVAEKLGESSRAPVRIDEQSLPVTFSMGFSIFPDDGDEVDILLSQADRAMFHAKSQGRNTIQFYADMTRKGLGKKDLYIQSRLAAAIDEGAIQAWFQPLVDARNHRAIGVEALARWHDPELGWVPPATFIPMAENLGLIAELGGQVFDQTLALGRTLIEAEGERSEEHTSELQSH